VTHNGLYVTLRSFLASFLAFSAIPLMSQIDVNPAGPTKKPTVQQLITTGEGAAQVLDMRLLPTKTEFDISLFNTGNGRRVLNYAPPYVSRYEDYRQLWKDYLLETLKLPVNLEDLEISEQNDTTKESYAIALTLDNSPSMMRPRALRMQSAVQHLLKVLDKRDQVSIVNFTGNVSTDVPLTADHDQALSTFSKIHGISGRSSGSAVYDGMMASLNQLASTPASSDRALIVFTDGEDNSSGADLEEVTARAKELNVKIYAIVYGLTDREPLDSLTRATGGKVRELVDADSFDKVFLGLYNSLRHTYTVSINNRTPESSENVLTAVTTVQSLSNEDIHTPDVIQALPKRATSIPDDVQTKSSLVMKMTVDFDASNTISTDDGASLDSVATLLIQRPDVEVEISNLVQQPQHQSEDAEMALMRTEAVRNLLIKRGVTPSRIRSLGSSVSMPSSGNRNIVMVFSRR